MKALLTVLVLLALSSSAIAQQQPDTTYIEKGKFTVGLGVSFISYHIWYKDQKDQVLYDLAILYQFP